MTDLTCPACGAGVPDTGMSSTGGSGDAGNVTWRETRQSAICDGCGERLVRNPESDAPELRAWRRRDD